MIRELKNNEVLILEYEQDFNIITKKFKTFKEYNDFVFNNLLNKSFSCYKKEVIK